MKKNELAEQWPSNFSPPSWLPDWDNDEQYEYLNSILQVTRKGEGALRKYSQEHIPIDKAGFAWEFLRRNPEYQEDFAHLQQIALAESIPKGLYSPEFSITLHDDDENPSSLDDDDEDDEINGVPPYKTPPSLLFHANLYRKMSRWGFFSRLPDPSLNLHEVGPFNHMTRWGMDFYLTQQTFEFDGEQIPLDGGITPNKNEVLWLFDSSLPVDPQIRRAKEFLLQQQESKDLKISSSKTSRDDYITYLRILDADAQMAAGGAAGKLREEDIALKFFESKRLSDAKNRSPHRDALNKARSSAYHLRNQGYLFLF